MTVEHIEFGFYKSKVTMLNEALRNYTELKSKADMYTEETSNEEAGRVSGTRYPKDITKRNGVNSSTQSIK